MDTERRATVVRFSEVERMAIRTIQRYLKEAFPGTDASMVAAVRYAVHATAESVTFKGDAP